MFHQPNKTFNSRMMRKGKEVSLSDDIHPNKKECFEYDNNINNQHSSSSSNPTNSSSSWSQFYPKVAPNLNVPTLVVLNTQESGSLENYVDHKDEGKQVSFSDDFDAHKEDCVEYEDEDEYVDDDVFNKLENLMLCGQEADLSDQVFKDNDQLQQDEVLALESIYGEKICILDDKSGLRSFQIHIHIELPEELTISTKLNTITNSSEDFLYSFQVNYLPPIILTCLLPKSYPTHLPPYFTISVQWLDSVKISSLCSMLDSIWNEQHGLEVIYSWVEWLHTSAISYLGFDKEIILGPYGGKDHVDPRAISGCVSTDVDISSLKRYNEEQQIESFLTNLQECCICFSEFAGSEFIRLPCQHFFCEICMKTYTDVLMQEGSVYKLLCPITKCGGMIPPDLIKQWLGDEKFEKWESLTLQKTLESMTDVVYCPRCETPCIVDDDQHAQCSKCFFNFCTLCMEKRHIGIMCPTPEMKLRFLQKRQESSQMGDKQRRREQGMIQQILSVKQILRDTKPCPFCKMPIVKDGGCNHMQCKNCGKHFCYQCNKAFGGYDHFREGECEMLEPEPLAEEEIMNEQEIIDQRKVVGQRLAELFPDKGRSCPRCGKNNVKSGKNNHIFCWACQGRYCYLCGEVVKRCSDHFGPDGCKQHTRLRV